MMLWYYKRLVDKYDVVSFDVFDTLIERDVLISTDVYKKIGINKVGKNRSEIFRIERIIAEKLAKCKAHGTECNIYDIYKCFSEEELKYHLVKDEIDYELNHCSVKKSGKKLFEYALSKGKKIICVSDMYLDSRTICNMLENCGYESVYRILVSSERGVSKKTGELYKDALEICGCSYDEIIHIGDSISADICGAKRAGIKSIMVMRNHWFVAKIKAMLIRCLTLIYEKTRKGI